jgi:hypothetical protein
MMKNRARFLFSLIATALFSLCTVTGVYAVTVSPEQADDNALEENGSAWDAAGESSSEAWEKTKAASSDVWDATRESSAKAWEGTRAFSSDAWDATSEGSAKAWDATKAYSGDAWESTMEWLNGTDEDASGETDTDEPSPADKGDDAGDSASSI